MAEVLGVIASVVGIASAGIALATRLHDIVDEFGSTFENIEVIATDLNGFAIVLDELSKKLNAPDSERVASNQLLSGIENVMRICEVLFKDIKDMIAGAEDSNTKMARFTTKIVWVLRKNKVKGVKATLECQKTTLSLMLQILRADDTSLQQAILKNLLREHDRTLAVLKAIQKENAALKIKENKRSSTTRSLEESAVYLPGDVPTDSGTSTQSAMVLLSNAVPRLLIEGPGADLKSEVDQNFSSGGRVTEVTEVFSTTEKNSDVDLLVTKWIRRPSIQAKESTSFPSKLPPNLQASSSAQQRPTRQFSRYYSPGEAKHDTPVNSAHEPAKSLSPRYPMYSPPKQAQDPYPSIAPKIVPRTKTTTPTSRSPRTSKYSLLGRPRIPIHLSHQNLFPEQKQQPPLQVLQIFQWAGRNSLREPMVTPVLSGARRLTMFQTTMIEPGKPGNNLIITTSTHRLIENGRKWRTQRSRKLNVPRSKILSKMDRNISPPSSEFSGFKQEG